MFWLNTSGARNFPRSLARTACAEPEPTLVHHRRGPRTRGSARLGPLCKTAWRAGRPRLRRQAAEPCAARTRTGVQRERARGAVTRGRSGMDGVRPANGGRETTPGGHSRGLRRSPAGRPSRDARISQQIGASERHGAARAAPRPPCETRVHRLNGLGGEGTAPDRATSGRGRRTAAARRSPGPWHGLRAAGRRRGQRRAET